MEGSLTLMMRAESMHYSVSRGLGKSLRGVRVLKLRRYRNNGVGRSNRLGRASFFTWFVSHARPAAGRCAPPSDFATEIDVVR